MTAGEDRRRDEADQGAPVAAGGRVIELKVREIGQLFQSLDPLPFRERDLDAAVEEFVVASAREQGGGEPVHILVHLPPEELGRAEAGHIAHAIRNYFAYRAEVTRWELKELFRVGRASLAIGLTVLALSVALGAELSSRVGEGYVDRLFGEGLIILGWVANWRPIQIFLYDWWPLARRRRLQKRLARATIDLRPTPG